MPVGKPYCAGVAIYGSLCSVSAAVTIAFSTLTQPRQAVYSRNIGITSNILSLRYAITLGPLAPQSGAPSHLAVQEATAQLYSVIGAQLGDQERHCAALHQYPIPFILRIAGGRTPTNLKVMTYCREKLTKQKKKDENIGFTQVCTKTRYQCSNL